MTFEIIVTLFLLAVIIGGLVFNLASADFLLFSGLVILVLSGVLPVKEALRGFSNPGVMTVALLFIVSAAIKNAGSLEFLAGRFLGLKSNRRFPSLLIRMMLPISALSAFINNTPIVVILTPVIKKWATQIGRSPSKFLIPLSYATVLGGTCTLIGTSTNLLAHGLFIENGMKGLSLFELAWVGVPCALTGLTYLTFFGNKLLPDRKDVQTHVEENPKEYVIGMKVAKRSALIGLSVSDAGLRNLQGVYLLDIEREGESIGPVSSKEVLKADDRLIFVGSPSAVVDLQEIPGLIPEAHDMFERDFARMSLHFVEVVISSSSPILGRTVKEGDFRKRYGAGVVAVHRNGERIVGKVGSIVLQSGDALLLFAGEGFIERWKDSQDFYLVSYLKNKPAELPHKAMTTMMVTGVMILAAAFGIYFPAIGLPAVSVLDVIMCAVVVLFVLKCISGREARQAIQWDILLVIAFSIGLSRAVQLSGVADGIGHFIKQHAGFLGPYGVLAVIYVVTLLMTEILTNNAAVALAFPIALATAVHLGVNPRPFLIAATMAASSGFASPLGYQTHLIVQGPGGYKFSDYVKIGLPLDLLIGLVAILVIPHHWSF